MLVKNSTKSWVSFETQVPLDMSLNRMNTFLNIFLVGRQGHDSEHVIELSTLHPLNDFANRIS
jgi:hypothetical protein